MEENKVMVEEINDVNKQPEDNNEPNKKKEKSKKKIVVIVVVILLLLAASITAFILFGKDVKEEKVTTEKEKVYSKYRMSGNGLDAFDLYFLNLENEQKNKVYSPLSIKYTLEMLKEGANGETKEQIESIVGDYKAKKYTNSANMSFANAMFVRDSYKENIKDTYTKTLLDKYNAEIIYDSFVSPEPFNQWVGNKTFNLINNLFDEEITELDFALVNALAIDMEWENVIQLQGTKGMIYSVNYIHENYSDYVDSLDMGYEKVKFNNSKDVKVLKIGASLNNYDIVNDLGRENIKKTITEEYQEYIKNNEEGGCYDHNLTVEQFVDKFIEELDSNYKQVDKSTDFELYTDDNVKVFAKDLKEYNGTTLQYVGIMPTTQNLDEYIKNVNKDTINNIIGSLKDIKLENFSEGKVTKIVGSIPLFKYEYDLKLIEDLQTLGIKDVFDSKKADLSNMSKTKGAFISTAKHKANIEFSNDGIKAAAATMGGGYGSAGCGFEHLYEVPVEVIDLTFDKPYMYIIRDKASGEVWFMGTVYEPIEFDEKVNQNF